MHRKPSNRWKVQIACMISAWFGGLAGGLATASETVWKPLPLDDAPEDVTSFSWIPASAPVPGVVKAGSISAVVGTRALGGAGWRNLGPAHQAGIDWSPGPASWPLRPVLGYRHARGAGEFSTAGTYSLDLAQLGTVTESAERGTRSADVHEVAVGIGRTWTWGVLHASLGAGGCWVRAQVQDQPAFTLMRRLGQAATAPSDDVDSGYGWWGAVATSVAIGATVVGVEGRYTDAPVSVFGDRLQAGGWQLGGRIGWSW